jgi:hypothetical protein
MAAWLRRATGADEPIHAGEESLYLAASPTTSRRELSITNVLLLDAVASIRSERTEIPTEDVAGPMAKQRVSIVWLSPNSYLYLRLAHDANRCLSDNYAP